MRPMKDIKVSHTVIERCPHVTDVVVRLQHGAHEQPEVGDPVVYDAAEDEDSDTTSVSYTPSYAAGWERVFGKSDVGKA
jgi:hypothetical protein